MRPTPFAQLKQDFQFLKDMDTEITLDMSPAVVSAVNPVPQIMDFSHHFKWKDGTPLKTIVMEIKSDAFEDLYMAAFKKRNTNDEYLTGLRICHGVLEDLSQELRFIPVYLRLRGNDFIVSKLGEYKYDSTPGKESFVESDDSGLDVDYRTNVLVSTNGNGTFNEFDSGTDAESVTYPFQTIYTMISDGKKNNLDYVTITNALWKDQGGKIVAKHSFLLMSVNIKHGVLGALTFNGSYANRSHLCPPCAKIKKTDFDFA